MTTTNTTSDVAQALESTPAQALDRFKTYTRAASFAMSLGIREIRMLRERPWGHAWAMQGSELDTLMKLIDKGLVEHTYGENPKLSEAGRLTRHLLVLSHHIPLDPKAEAVPDDVLRWLGHASGWHSADPFAAKASEVRQIDGETHLVLFFREAGRQGVSEWAVPASALKRIG